MFELIKCGYRYTYANGLTISRPNGAGDYAFVFFKNKSEVVLNGKSILVDGDTYILYRPTTPQFYREYDLPYVDDWFHAVGLEDLLAELNFPLDTLIPAADPLLISRSIMEMHRIKKMGGPHAARILDSEIRSLILKLSNLLEMSLLTDRPNRYFRQLSELRDELYNAPHNHPTVEELASRINISKSHFQHLYKDLFGCSVVTDMINGRLEYAKYLLQNSSLTVSAIADKCGYEHETHFMRQFKKFVGLTPGRFRSVSDKKPLQA